MENNSINISRVVKISSRLFLLIFLFASCSYFSKNEPEQEKAIALPVFEVDTGAVELNKTFIGAVEGKFNVEIRPQIEGELQEAYADEGDYVEKGQKLFKIDSQSYQEELNQAIANENVEKANLNNAATEVERLKPLVENKVMAPVRLETEKSNYAVAEANLKQASAEVANAKIRLGYATIKAPVNGYIGRIRQRIGNLVKPGDNEPITVLTDVQEVYVYFSINESEFYNMPKIDSTKIDTLSSGSKVFSDQKVSLILPDGSTYKETGYIDATSGQVNKNTGTITLRATFPNEDNVLRSGNTGTLIMYDRRKGQILIPQKATYELQAKTFVQKLTKDNKTVRQPITIESEAPNNFYVVESGLKKGDRILVEGQDKVSDSTKIKPLEYHPDTLMAPDEINIPVSTPVEVE